METETAIPPVHRFAHEMKPAIQQVVAHRVLAGSEEFCIMEAPGTYTHAVVAQRDYVKDWRDLEHYQPPEFLRETYSDDWEDFVRREIISKRRLLLVKALSGHYDPFVYWWAVSAQDALKHATKARKQGLIVHGTYRVTLVRPISTTNQLFKSA